MVEGAGSFGLVGGGAMVDLPTASSSETVSVSFSAIAYRRPCRIQPRYHLFLGEACPHHRGVAGITEDGSCYAHPNTFRAERDGRFNWSSYRTVVLHVTERGVIIAPFLPLLITGTIKMIIYIGDRHSA